MTTIQIDRAAYAEAVGEPIELLDPLPQLALARDGVTLTPFQLALPNGDGSFSAVFAIESHMAVSQGAVRYGDLRPVYLNLNGGLEVHVLAGDVMELLLERY